MDDSGLTRDQLESLLYGGRDLLRFTQDTPILPDVWMEYARYPAAVRQLLLTPHQGTGPGQTRPGPLSLEVRAGLARERARERRESQPARVSYNRTTVLVPMSFPELVRVALPMSEWWWDRILEVAPGAVPPAEEAEADTKSPPAWLTGINDLPVQQSLVEALDGASAPAAGVFPPAVLWLVRVIGTIEYLRQFRGTEEEEKSLKDTWLQVEPRREESHVFSEEPPGPARSTEARNRYHWDVVKAFATVMADLQSPTESGAPRLHLISLNRQAVTTISQSRGAVKADVAYRIFDIDCSELTWAVIDSGIDARHPAFRWRRPDQSLAGTAIEPAQLKAESRVVKSYDFTIVQHLLNPDVLRAGASLPKWLSPEQRQRVEEVLKQGANELADLQMSLQSGKEVDWDLLTPFIEVPHRPEAPGQPGYRPPRHEHGTHVAGIIGAAAPDPVPGASPGRARVVRSGICPDIRLYDLRVLNDRGVGSEFNVMAALQFVRHLNANSATRVISGVNLSLSIRHEVANYACGCTPVCEECRRLVWAGVVVVAAAGNEGYQQYMDMSERPVDTYRYISITDPGNAEDVITVGATHRSQPHTYGVSYFSSRGPTGDGRAKPDLVAPGEKIESALPCTALPADGRYGSMDGTSMAAPHVSGAAALLIARHRELDGKPAEVKRILCESATDLGRERYFQGHGMLDVLRAIQSF